MCGIAGFLGGAWPNPPQLDALLGRMAQAIDHRGPDHKGIWTDRESALAFVHARLAIVDLSPAGEQPMHSSSGRYVLLYNGEIYNHMALRDELAAAGARFAWRGHSDTETLLAGIETWGLKATLERSTGMFALALWDRQERTLALARDRLGEKPLYFGWQGSGPNAAFLFASELKPIVLHPAFAGEVSRDALTLLMRYGYIPAPYSIYTSIRKLEPGTILTLSDRKREGNSETYWSGAEIAVAGAAKSLDLTPDEAVSGLEDVLTKAVGQQMVADVPLGAFLSGGIDSSTIVALMQKQAARPVRTFSIGFHEDGYNEAEHAKAVARHLGTDHTELYISPEQAQAVIPRLPDIYDEPFADSSQIPTFLVSQMARQHVTVSLSGDAGDELFGGYTRYGMTARFWRRMAAIPAPLRDLGASGLKSLPAATWDRLLKMVPPAPASVTGDRVHKGAALLASRSIDDLYRRLVSAWKHPSELVIGGHEPATLLAGDTPALPGLDVAERMMALDMLTYLPDDILAKVDRAAMAVSLETRVPMLNHAVVEYAWRLPMSYKVRDGQTKWVLRQLLYRHVPQTLMDRPKMGFGVPIESWLRGPLRDWAEHLLDERHLREQGYFKPAPIRDLWQRHLGGKENHQHALWIVLMFQAWLEAQSAGNSQIARATRDAIPA